MRARHISNGFGVAAVALLVLLSLTSGAVALGPSPSNSSPNAFPVSTWNIWAKVSWRYFQNCWSPSYGLPHDACGWPRDTDWGLASYVFALVSADELGWNVVTVLQNGNPDPYNFTVRVDKVLNYLNTRQLTGSPGHWVPYREYFSDSGTPNTGGGVSNSADYGRLLAALYLLKTHLTGLGGQQNLQRAGRVDSAVARVDNSYYDSGFGPNLYSYYSGLGFTLLGFESTKISTTRAGFWNRIQNGPFVSSSLMYGVQGIPDKIGTSEPYFRINGEPFVNAILELGDVPQVTGLPSWGDFVGLSGLVYDAQEQRSVATGKPEFWTEGGLNFPPGFVYEWIVYDTGATWIKLDANEPPNLLTDSRLPVAYAKLMFGYSALYGTPYAENMLNTYANQLQTTNGFVEGVNRDGGINSNVQIQTNEIILSAANFAAKHSGLAPLGPDFTVSSAPQSLSILPSFSAPSTINVTSFRGFNSGVALSGTWVGPIPTQVILAFNPSPVTPPSAHSAYSTLTVTVGSTASTGTFTLRVTGTNGALNHYAVISITIQTLVTKIVTLTITSTTSSTGTTTSTSTIYTDTTTKTSTIVVPTTVTVNPSESTSTVRTTQTVTSTGTLTVSVAGTTTTTLTSYATTTTSTSTIVVPTTVTVDPFASTATVQITQIQTSTGTATVSVPGTLTTTVTSYTSTTTSTSTNVVYTTVTSLASVAASTPFMYLGLLSLFAVTLGHRATAGKGRRIPKLRSLMGRRCTKT